MFNLNITLNGTDFGQVPQATLLNVTIDDNETRREQIQMVGTKILKGIAVVYKTKHVLDVHALRTLY